MNTYCPMCSHFNCLGVFKEALLRQTCNAAWYMFDLSSAGLQNNRVTHELDLITGALISASQHPKNILILMPFPLIN